MINRILKSIGFTYLFLPILFIMMIFGKIVQPFFILFLFEFIFWIITGKCFYMEVQYFLGLER